MGHKPNLPSYAELFGKLDFKKGDEARSVYSPAAYLADLLQLLDDKFAGTPEDTFVHSLFLKRRPDIPKITLDHENTFTEIPYLDIVNEVLETVIYDALEAQQHALRDERPGARQQAVYEALKHARYPLQLPFDLDTEKLRKYLQYLHISPKQLYTLFERQPDSSVIAREYLGLSQAEYDLITIPLCVEDDIKALYQLSAGQSWDELVDIGMFLRASGLTGSELRELLFQNLAQSARDAQNRSERRQAITFFIHAELEGFVTLGPDEETLVWSDSSRAIPAAWFERVSRFVRLAKKSGLSFSDLDLILRNCCDNRLDVAAICTVAVIKHLHERHELPVDVVCSLVGPLNTLGIGDEAMPQDLFNRVFNARFAAIEKQYIAGSDFTPVAYAIPQYTHLECSGDLLAPNNKAYRRRLCSALEISERDITLIVSRFRSKYAAAPSDTVLAAERKLDIEALALLYRVTTLATALDISPAELFNLLDVLEQDPSIRKDNNFDLLIDAESQSQDFYRILEQGPPSETLWLVQMVFAVAEWMRANDFTSAELRLILSGCRQNAAEESTNRGQRIAAFNSLYQQFKAVLLAPDVFVSDRFDTRAARVVHQTLIEYGGLVAEQDHRLARFDAGRAAAAAYQALDQLAVIRKEDFLQLGLEERLLDKIMANLVFLGYLDAESTIVESKLPAGAATFKLASDLSAHADAIFTRLHELYADAAREQEANAEETTEEETTEEETTEEETAEEETAEEETDEEETAEEETAEEETDAAQIDKYPVEVSLFPSDLVELEGLTEAQRNEIYDNLIFNGYIDAEGNVTAADAFALPENVANFQINVDLSAVEADIFAQITRRIAQFNAAPLKLDSSIFDNLGLTAVQTADLIENLRFNGYIDQAGVLVDKLALLALTDDKLQLAIDFYPLRRSIQEALKTLISDFKVDFFTISRDSLQPIAAAAVAQEVLSRLAAEYLFDKRIIVEREAWFLDRDNLAGFDLGQGFSPADHELIFDQLAGIIADRHKYQLPLQALADLDFDQEETAELLETLIIAGDLTRTLQLPEDKISYFLNVNNALEFSIDAFADYNKDIFFILRDMAQESAAAIDEIVARLKDQADTQAGTVFDALQEALGVDVDVIMVACRYLLRGIAQVVEASMLPILATVDRDDTISTEPASNLFHAFYRRLEQFALLAAKLGLSAQEAEIVFRDQDLVEKFPEPLVLPPGIDTFDALLDDPAGLIYLFKGSRYWLYSAATYVLSEPAGYALEMLSSRLAGVSEIDAAFADSSGTLYLVAGDACFSRAPGSTEWLKQTRSWGRIQNNFADLARIDTAFRDRDGKTYLFAGDQYIRYSGADYAQAVDEGYPLPIVGNWEHEGLNAQLPDQFRVMIDASFQDTEGVTYLFKDSSYVSSAALGEPIDIRARWGRVRNVFQDLRQLDSAYTDGAAYYFFAGDQVAVYQDNIENGQVCMREGYPQSIEAHFSNLPAEFERGLETVFKGADGRIHFFKDGKTIAWEPGCAEPETIPTNQRWGIVINTILETGKVDAAFVGLDGRTYLFSADHYVRYCGADYSQVDEGYPRRIADDWGGLQTVNAAFTLDGKTYLFGADASGQVVHVRYSTKDYSIPDAGYPSEPNDNWWNLPAALAQEDALFKHIDAVFNGKDNRTYLFSGDQFIAFDNKHRWWSEPQSLQTQWNSIPFAGVDAAFVGKDGKTYVFYDKQYIRYSNSTYNKIDDRYPKEISAYWGNVVNIIAKTGKVDAALVIEVQDLVDGVAQSTTHTYTYLFAGNQYVRYVGNQYEKVEPGYPKYIASSLKSEPRFQELSAALGSGIDAAFADRRTIYLFKGDTCYALSDALTANYDKLGFTTPGCAFLEHGAALIEEAGVWRRYSALEGKTVVSAPAAPATLYGVPEAFRHNLDAVLQGVDGNTYLFKGADCFDLLLNRAYPLAEEWGRARNAIYQHNTVDAAFMGRDNKTYLFSGDQFFTYTARSYTDSELEGEPEAIAECWGGLTSVALAYVQGQSTYVFEKADSQGAFRYIRYSTPDYSRPDPGFPQVATIDFWQIPEGYRTPGFDAVSAVLFDGDNMFLIGHDLYIQHNLATNLWSYPRPLSRIWRNFPLNRLNFPGVKTAFSGADGATYFFSDEMFVRYSSQGFSDPAPIRDSWGLTHNNFVHNSGGNRIDAAVVWQSRTYLFSGDQYVRYSGRDYRAVDAGYPRPLLGNLRHEEGFQNLPASFDDLLTGRIAGQRRRLIQAAFANQRNLYLLIDDRCYIVSQSTTATYDLGIIGHVKNNLVDRNHVDAALVGNEVDGHRPTFLFCGDQYVRYSSADYTYVDDGYPRSLASFAADLGASAALPNAFAEGLDAALYGGDGHIYLFKGAEYLNLADGKPLPIRATWGKVTNCFVDTPGDTTIDAGFIAPAGGLYLFKGAQYIRYQTPQHELVDAGYPRAIKDSWGNLPAKFEQSIDGAFVLSGKTYMVKGGEYVRYSDSRYGAIDSLQAFKYRWGAWADYLLSDIKTITRFKQLQDAHAGGDSDLVAFLNPPPDVVKTPFEMLAAIFGWDLDDISWLKRHNGFLNTDYLSEEQFQLELIIRFCDIFAIAQTIGAPLKELFENVWQKLYATHEPSQAAESLYSYLAKKQSEQDWLVLARQIHDEINLLRRDALIAMVIARRDDIQNIRQLYERFLIDVEMGAGGMTSRIQEAIAATQLVLHRYFVNLEQAQLKEGPDAVTRGELKSWWKWMKNYRVWEANRKVFLYPENYIRPELRDTKTPAFKTLEDDLLQGEITSTTVERAYKRYLDEYTEVSRLTIAGGYVYQAPGTKKANRKLVLFGRTKPDPRRYYYRQAEFLDGDTSSALWTPWSSVNVQIDANTVCPVFAFDRVFVFWYKVEAVADTPTDMAVTGTPSANNQLTPTDAATTYAINIYYSFYNLNKEWVPRQILDAEIKHRGTIKNVKLFIENSDKLTVQGKTGLHQNIIVNCTYTVNGAEVNQAFSLTPELYTESADKPRFDNTAINLFQALFDEPAINPANVVMFNTMERSLDGYWFSFDYKGGSFLCKPAATALSDDAWPIDLAGNADRLPCWKRIDAAFEAPDGKSYFFDNSNSQYAVVDSANPMSQPAPIKQRWGKVLNHLADTGVVDAVFVSGEYTYVFSGDQYVRYSGFSYDYIDEGYPRLIQENDEGFPRWSRVDAAFTGLDGKSYFFNNQARQFVQLGDLDNPRSVADYWGKLNVPADLAVTLAFTQGDYTYLVCGTFFVRFKGANYTAFEDGYPQPFAGPALLSELGYTTASSIDMNKIDTSKVAGAFFYDGNLYLRYKGRLYRLPIDVQNPAGEEFQKYLDRPIQAVAVANKRIYVFKSNTDNENPFTTLCIYNVGAKKWEHNSVKIVNEDGQPIQIDAALVGSDNKFYLFAGSNYMQSDDWIQLIQSHAASARTTDDSPQPESFICWNPQPGSIAHDWLCLSNRIAETGTVDAAFVDGNYTYLFAGDQYIRYSGDTYTWIDTGYPRPIQTNSENIPGWDHIDAAFNAGGTAYFFDNGDQTYVQWGQLAGKRSTRAAWGRLENALFDLGIVDAAYVVGNSYLFLTSRGQFVRYTLAAGQGPGDYVDPGYPRTFHWPDLEGMGKINAAFQQGDRVYVFSGDRYTQLASSAEPDTLSGFKYIQGNWGNLPYELRSGIDAALDRDDGLYLFKGDQYVKYTKKTNGTNAAAPYEIWDTSYDLVRLTTSTAYKLNQTLFSGGVPALLTSATQEIDETPSFSQVVSTPTTIKVRAGKVSADRLPISAHLDFDSANGLYYWEIFFHAPFLIAQALNSGQKFEEARQWYEYIFDPTDPDEHWKFLPFLAVDVQTLLAAYRGNLQGLKDLGVDTAAVEGIFDAPGHSIFAALQGLVEVFQQRRPPSDEEKQLLKDSISSDALDALERAVGALAAPAGTGKAPRFAQLSAALSEGVGLLRTLRRSSDQLGNQQIQIETYRSDPFDPHAIAALRPGAYRKAIVMAYVDNLLDWGDMLFRQYTRESINEARMLYILAYDLLGEKPENLGTLVSSPATSYDGLIDSPDNSELTLYQRGPSVVGDQTLTIILGTPHESVGNPYFFVPENSQFGDYWSRVEDRLYKIRHSLNILGISQPLPLFEPPIDPMALVQAVSSGAALGSALASMNIPVPHYRFSFILRKAQDLAQKLNGFGADLLSVLEKKDAEELNLMQNRQEAEILSKTREIKVAQIAAAGKTIAELQASLAGAQQRETHYQSLIDEGLLPIEEAQIGLMITAAATNLISAAIKLGAAIAHGFPQVKIGPFIFGTEVGGKQVGDSLGKIGEFTEALGQTLNATGEVLGLYANHLRVAQDWDLQLKIARSEIAQIGFQLEGAQLQQQIAQIELEIHDKEIEHNAEIKAFMQGKFSNAQLYQWMISRLGGLYFQTYGMAYDMARAAEKAFQFERGLKAGDVNFIQPLYWETQRQGLLAGESLGLDLDRMEKAYIDSNSRGFEITKNISLLDLDPVALLQFKRKGVCQFTLGEALFDYDFPGHYCRQIKTVAITFPNAEGQRVNLNATLTQLSHQTVLEPDARAVKYLLEPRDQPPPALRSDWRASQQIALSYVDEYDKNNGLFELRFDDERYLPFEGTGAVSTWRLELGGRKDAGLLSDLADVTITLKYSAEQGEAAFATAVKGMLKPYPAARFFDIASEFPEAWQAFVDGEQPALTLSLTRDMFPNMSGGKVSGLFAGYTLSQPGALSLMLNGDQDLSLGDGRFLPTSGLSIGSQGANWTFTVKGDRQILENIGLVVGYRAKVE